ncbi:hypothetical protein AU210_016263 [Fusarium oxysporum f. sp. radicis-cucumerinum]|uniref:PDZ domain-containing protein n=1 Tax=Fusarium oxysporum f. sp. radicis-cucumerinum TaxID=327505 RepID=A0A2H3FNL7_FUSOX|nr:hypothetical protein AU210_016263 [Fusarium oxysporum f. sp. radicis-cucumerinum]
MDRHRGQPIKTSGPSKCVVKIRIRRPIAFETNGPGVFEVYGLLVDAQEGIVLTVRHATGPGPISGTMVLQGKQEVEVRPMYCDPVHDFGFLQYDPKSVRIPGLAAVDFVFHPPKAFAEARDMYYISDKMGNLHRCCIARVDSNPPHGSDFNTHYYEVKAKVAAGVIGGPVFNGDGQPVAIQTGSSNPDCLHALPLSYPERVLKQIQNREEVKRGDVQTLFTLRNSRDAHRQKLIMVHSVLSGGPADGKLEGGDILTEINGDPVTDLPSLNTIFDENIGNKVSILVDRSGQHLELEIEVQNLYETTPSSLLMVDEATFHDVSWHDAYRCRHSRHGVSISNSGHNFQPIKEGAIIQKVNNKATTGLATFVKAIREIPAGTRVLIEFWHPLQQCVTSEIVPIDSGWLPSLRGFKRNAMTGKWDAETYERLSSATERQCNVISPAPTFHGTASTIAEIRSTSRVLVRSRPRYGVEGQDANVKSGFGLVINAQKGFVLVSRAIVPHLFCDIQVTVAQSTIRRASVKFLHPWHYWAIVCYDPSSVCVLVKSTKLSTQDISQGQEITFVGCDDYGVFVEDSASIVEIIAQGTEFLSWHTPPPVDIDVIEVGAALRYKCDSGFLIATDATVQGLWIAPEGLWMAPEASCPNKNRFGVDSRGIAAIAKDLSQGVDVSFWRLPLELRSIEIPDLEARGVSIEWIEKVLDKRSDHCMLMVERTWSQEPHQFQHGDILLTLNGKLVTRPSDVIATDSKAIRDVLVSRNGKEISIRACAVPEYDFETTRLATFGGLVVHKPHRTVRHSVKKPPSEIWVASICPGSPAELYDVPLESFIKDVDGKPVSCIKSLLSVICQIPNNKEFTMEIINRHGNSQKVALKKDEFFFPTIERRRSPPVLGG